MKLKGTGPDDHVQINLSGSNIDGSAPARSWALTDGCTDWNVAVDRSSILVETAVPPVNGETIWRDSVSSALPGILHAAALLGHSDEKLISCIANADVAMYQEVIEAVDPSGAHPSHRSFSWLHNDRGIAENTRKSIFFVMSQQVLGGFSYEVVKNPPFRIDKFISRQSSTAYLTIPYARREKMKTLVSAFIESLVSEWRRARLDGSIGQDRTLLLVLDEAANISPLPSLPGLLTSGAGDGIQVVFVLQTPGHASIWQGEEEVILNGSQLVAVLPGLRDEGYLARLARLSHMAIHYDTAITVSADWTGGERYASAENLVSERQILEDATKGQPTRAHHRIHLRVAQELSRARRNRRIRTVEDDTANPISVLEEIMKFTDVTLVQERRTSLEVSDLAQAAPNTVALFNGPQYRQLSITHWSMNALWKAVLDPT